MMLCSAFRTQIQTWLRDYDRIQSFAVILIYVQIGCALIGSLGALYNGVSLINLGIGLFALVAIESSSQSLGRTYAVLLFCAILVDISWFILFASEIWNISSGIYGTFVIFSVKLTLSMQIIGFCVRLSSSLLWIQMYKLGVSYIDCSVPREADSDMRNSFLNPATPITRQPSNSDDALGGSVYDPAYYSSLFEDGKDEMYFCRGSQNNGFVIGSPSTAKTTQFKPSMSRSIRITDLSKETSPLLFIAHESLLAILMEIVVFKYYPVKVEGKLNLVII
ncbi:uncharacterized protein LOC129887409 isoform X3 [Solanum dulcamara]|uniref:uncharacterized protein LOC129887409 isoform X3 n=1 Tax=Solanum dulcamara TaxID=45834 RepID=UPI0024860421|nr:uncharacterized protein LOC129887409 isoform X3 [Solanum dulcamara]